MEEVESARNRKERGATSSICVVVVAVCEFSDEWVNSLNTVPKRKIMHETISLVKSIR